MNECLQEEYKYLWDLMLHWYVMNPEYRQRITLANATGTSTGTVVAHASNQLASPTTTNARDLSRSASPSRTPQHKGSGHPVTDGHVVHVNHT